MPRRREVPKREVLPDPKYGSVDLSKFMNVIMTGSGLAIESLRDAFRPIVVRPWEWAVVVTSRPRATPTFSAWADALTVHTPAPTVQVPPMTSA